LRDDIFDEDSTAPDFDDDDYAGPPMTVGDIVAEFETLGACCIRASAATGLGIDEIAAALLGHITVLSGQSGVGKSTLLNRIQPGLQLGTADVSEESEKGRHTTTLARLLRLDNGAHVVDTPGIRTFSLWSVEPGELESYFAEFVPLVPECRFNDCHHTDELDCAIRAAAETGEISMRRYWSYVKMLEELAEERHR
jgi:ribosome biogenesis GTPase